VTIGDLARFERRTACNKPRRSAENRIRGHPRQKNCIERMTLARSSLFVRRVTPFAEKDPMSWLQWTEAGEAIRCEHARREIAPANNLWGSCPVWKPILGDK
jgi:hypothetical protein